ncbi:uncharacterized protein BP01DRAFT_178340 [Aspergillus saccharolyticus JOP 1030-1]|uniref:Uncharacterized protein n=1 Tax=Aspergillus saccharolyticus JOP 1030-1 TaxID=1450539 RepID=A0A318ZNJ7_9EURO|nr:hypothetical protein BP01DRAFT_178340 [Aspergillus saccharolyticus JOP 1030-1]PYH48225.1 hypothetical protein BP01DRAFT_178340 [Aspergillus saccharolyticus JOP 1030-1]
MAWLSILRGGFNALIYLTVYLVSWAYGLLRILTSPFVALGYLVLHIALFPVKFLIKLEALFVFLATAILAGICLGLILFGTTTLTVETANRLVNLILSTAAQKFYGNDDDLLDSTGKTTPSPSDLSTEDDYFTAWHGRQASRDLKKAALLADIIVEEEEASRSSSHSR